MPSPKLLLGPALIKTNYFVTPETYPWRVALQHCSRPFHLQNKCKRYSGLKRMCKLVAGLSFHTVNFFQDGSICLPLRSNRTSKASKRTNLGGHKFR